MITKQQLQTMSEDEVYDTLGLIIGEYLPRFAIHDAIMPLAFEHGVGFAPNKDSWEAFTLEDNYQVIQNQFVDGSPLRAIACCLILVLQEEKK